MLLPPLPQCRHYVWAKGGCVIHTCRTPEASAETMVLTAAAALAINDESKTFSSWPKAFGALKV
jgi:hypothetical protein